MSNRPTAPFLWWLEPSEEQHFLARLQSSLQHPVLATRHLRLRELAAADIACLGALWQGRDRGTTSHPCVSTSEDVAVQTASCIRLNDSSVHWCVCWLDSDELLGYFCLQDIDLKRSQAELRFWLQPVPGWESRAVEAGQAVLAYAFGNLSLVTVHAFSACGQRSTYDALIRIGMRPLDCNSQARESWGRCPEVQVWNVARHRWMRSLRM